MSDFCTLKTKLPRDFKAVCHGTHCKYSEKSHLNDWIGINCRELKFYLSHTFEEIYKRKYTVKDDIHIHHIIPIHTAATLEDLRMLMNYKNLCWLLARDHVKVHRQMKRGTPCQILGHPL
jgi:hypothetical protein